MPRPFRRTVTACLRATLLEGDVAAGFLTTLMARPRVKRLLSSDHFSVDGTMIQAWSSMKSLKPIEPCEGPGDEPPPSSGRNAEADVLLAFHAGYW